MRIVIALVLPILLAGCPQTREDMQRDETTQKWEQVVRWNMFDSMANFMHPDWLAEHPVTDFEVQRLQQFKVSQYRVRQVISLPDGTGFDRIVELRLYHLHTARERVVEHLESWRWDEERKRWMLHSGLPDPTRR
ncbi:MAG: hypothetical protein CVV18_02665 [Gammaproteobacteria bacterium HGW-Gammaproteobacteria-8]|nr:MAG: hypothetical protein CVV18_02665 [Gammaproteobacteria bacterium HGW-Gammaproteobacteria-8]